jgi:hypothetical protein
MAGIRQWLKLPECERLVDFDGPEREGFYFIARRAVDTLQLTKTERARGDLLI